VRVQFVDVHAPTWGAELDRIGLAVRRDGAVPLPPYHFLYVTLPRIGGGAAWVSAPDGPILGVGFLFPRHRNPDGKPAYTFRYHPVPGATPPEQSVICDEVSRQLGDADVVFFDTLATHHYAPSAQQIGAVSIGRPTADEAAAVPMLHHVIWGSPPEFLYPADMHSVAFAAGTSLVARVEGQLVGFLLGFRKFGGSKLPAGWHDRLNGSDRIESQIIGVLPAYRGMRIANLLKKVQAEHARNGGIGIVNWTADPLQYPNAALNLGLLRAVAFEFAPDLYPFRNSLNRVHASRLTLTWLVGSDRVRNAPMIGARAQLLDLAHHPEVVLINEGLRIRTLEPSEPVVAIEIPANWSALQESQIHAAQAWREVTDAILQHLLGMEEGQYVLTNAGVLDDRRFLIAERVTPVLLSQLISGS